MKSLLSIAAVAGLLIAGNTLAIDTDALTEALASPQRSDADKALDNARKPVEVLDYLGLEEGMTVLDIMSGGGWYTEVLSRAVGEDGTVYMQNGPASLARGNTADTVAARLQNLDNVERLDMDTADLNLAANSIDFAITNLNFHDVYNANPENAQAFLAAVHRVLKPGATFALIDHEGTPGADNAGLHRIPLEDALAAVQEAGFTVVESDSDILNVPSDDHTQAPFAAELERNTDRFILKLTK